MFDPRAGSRGWCAARSGRGAAGAAGVAARGLGRAEALTSLPGVSGDRGRDQRVFGDADAPCRSATTTFRR